MAKTGEGTLLLANQFISSNGVSIEEGILALDATGQLNTPVTNEATLQILDGTHSISSITGNGTTEVLAGSLTVQSLEQDTLVIGHSATAAAQTIPEPGVMTPLATGLLLCWAIRKRLNK
jgi:hypothetical protein